MRNILLNVAVALSAFIVTSCVFSSNQDEETITINRVAVVSFTISDWDGAIRTGSVGNSPAVDLVSKAATEMLHDTEAKLRSKWSVVKTSSFVNTPAYRNLRSPMDPSVIVPKINGQEMSVFTQINGEIKGGMIDPKTAMDLCKSLNVDGIILVFSEWTAGTEGDIQMIRAATKNIFTIWDSNGQLVTKKRVDMMGVKALGSSGFKALNENTVGEWQDSFSRAMDKILKYI